MTFAGTNIKQALHIDMATILSSPVGVMDEPGWDLPLSYGHHKPPEAVVAHRCDERGSSLCMYANRCPADKPGTQSPPATAQRSDLRPEPRLRASTCSPLTRFG